MTAKTIFLILRHISKLYSTPYLCLKFLLEEGPKTNMDMLIKFRKEQSVISQAILPLQKWGVLSMEKEGKFHNFSVNQQVWSNILAMCHDIARTPIDKIGIEEYDLKALKSTKEVLHPMYAFCKDDVRFRIYKYISENPGTIVKSIYNKLNIEQSICSTHLKLLKNAGWVKEERDGKCIKKYITDLEKTVYQNLTKFNFPFTHIIHCEGVDFKILAPNGAGPIVSSSELMYDRLEKEKVNIEDIEIGKPIEDLDTPNVIAISGQI